MSQTITHTEHSFAAICPMIRGRESLISKITTRLGKLVKTRRPKHSARSKHQSFMDANLLDATMGPEIGRTLGR